MKTYQKIVECFAVLADPSKPDREPAFDVHVVTMIDLEDGSPHFADPRQPVKVLNMEQARALGVDIPQIAAAFDADSAKEVVKLKAKVRDLEDTQKAADRDVKDGK